MASEITHLPTWSPPAQRWAGFEASYGYAEPRAWQVAALDAVIEHLSKPRPADAVADGALVRAVMGAGKSLLIAELARCRRCAADEVVVVTTSSRMLVRQLSRDLRRRLGPDAVGVYYSDRKQPDRRVIVTTTMSTPQVALRLAEQGRRVALWVADEAHRTECATIIGAAEALAATHLVGLTATPFRSEPDERLSMFGALVYSYSIYDAIRDGVLVEPVVIPYVGGDDPDVTVDDVLCDMLQRAVGPGIVNAVDCADADAYAARLTAEGIPAASVHSKMRRREIKARLDELERGELRAIVHVNLLTEGADYPWLRWLAFRRPAAGDVRFLQEMGRVLRTAPGKQQAVIYDPNGLFDGRDLCREAEVGCEGAAIIYARGRTDAIVAMQVMACRAWLEDKRWGSAGVVVDPASGDDGERRAQAQVDVLLDGVITDVVAHHIYDVPEAVRCHLSHRGATLHIVDVGAARERSEPTERTHRSPRPLSMDQVAAYLYRTALRFEFRGHIAPRSFGRLTWRSDKPSTKQLGAVRRCVRHPQVRRAAETTPDLDRLHLREAVRGAAELDKGALSDLLGILFALQQLGAWPLPEIDEIAA